MVQFDLSNNSVTDPLINGAGRVLPKIPLAIGAFLFGIVVIRLISWLVQFLLGFVHLPRGLKGIIQSLVDAVLWIFLIIGILQVLGLNNIALAFSGSIIAVGLAIGNGASALASDILAGIFLAKDRDFSIGDHVKAGEGTDGVIESMDMRRIRIRDSKGHLHVLPNSIVERKEWVFLESRAERKQGK